MKRLCRVCLIQNGDYSEMIKEGDIDRGVENRYVGDESALIGWYDCIRRVHK